MSGEQGLETDIGGALPLPDGSAAGRDRAINRYGERYENKNHICAVHVYNQE